MALDRCSSRFLCATDIIYCTNTVQYYIDRIDWWKAVSSELGKESDMTGLIWCFKRRGYNKEAWDLAMSWLLPSVPGAVSGGATNLSSKVKRPVIARQRRHDAQISICPCLWNRKTFYAIQQCSWKDALINNRTTYNIIHVYYYHTNWHRGTCHCHILHGSVGEPQFPGEMSEDCSGQALCQDVAKGTMTSPGDMLASWRGPPDSNTAEYTVNTVEESE